MKKIFLLFFISLSASANSIHLLEVSGSINPGSANYILEGIERAEKENAQAVLIKLNTPGGLLSSTRDIIQKFSSSKVPVILFISPGGASATSAGALIAISSHLAVMSQGTNIGAAHPVGSGGEEVKGVMGEKVTNDTAALARSQAKLRGRKSEPAELIVTKSKSFTAEEALREGIIDFIAKDNEDLLRTIDGKKVKIGEQEIIFSTKNIAPLIRKEMNLKQKFLHQISDPNISTLLMTIGGLALYVEINAGFSMILPGILGAFCLILGFISMQTLPINIGAALLFLLGFFLLIAEAYITSYGFLTLGAMVSLFLGGLFLIDPSSGGMKVSLSILISLVGSIGLISAMIAYMILRERKLLKHLPKDPIVGHKAKITVLNEDKRSGTAMVNGELWSFYSEDCFALGEEALVKSMKDMHIKLEKEK